MIAGNLLALPQTNLKRLLAYSGVAQIGYVLLAVAAGVSFGADMALFFFVAGNRFSIRALSNLLSIWSAAASLCRSTQTERL